MISDIKPNNSTEAAILPMQCYGQYGQEKVLIGLSGGINSAAVLADFMKSGIQPKELHLFYAHFIEHSPDTFQFVADCIRKAREHFDCVVVKITKNSIIKYFREQNMIPHPIVSPCSKNLKIIPINEYAFVNGIKYDLVGYVKNEMKRRAGRQQKRLIAGELEKHYPIGQFTDEWCFEIVDEVIGWHPRIYDIVDENGKRIFKHNNCLPCKNMNPKDFAAVKKYYPDYYEQAFRLSEELKRHWGRSADDFYTSFENRELGQRSTCEVCEW